MRGYQGSAGSVFAAFCRIARRDAALAAGVVAFWAAESAAADEIPAYGVSVVDSVVVEWSYNFDTLFGYVNLRAAPGTAAYAVRASFETPGVPIEFWWADWPGYETEITNLSAVAPDRVGYEHVARYFGVTSWPWHDMTQFGAQFSISAVPVELAWSTYRVEQLDATLEIPFVTVQSIIPEPSAVALLAAGALAAAARRREE